MNIQLSFLKRPRFFTAAFFFQLLILLLSAPAQATTIVSVDHRVTVAFSEFRFDPRLATYSTEVRVTNISASPILAPMRLIVTSIAGKHIRVLNAAGVGADGQPYIEFMLPQGTLGAGGTTAAALVFIRDKEKDEDKQDKDDAKKNRDWNLNPFGSNGQVKESDKDKNKNQADNDDEKKTKHRNHVPFDFNYQITGGVAQAPLAPRASPYALTVNSGQVQVRFSVSLADIGAANAPVYLRQINNGQIIPMNDQGAGGDMVAGDGIHGAYVTVNTAIRQPGTCLLFEAYTNSNGAEVVSPSTRLCISSFPVRIAESNTANPVTLPDGSKVVADEILVTVVQDTSEALISRLAADINASVVGSIPPRNLYQLKLSAPVSAARLQALVNQVQARPGVESATFNAIGAYAFVPSDPEYASQHGLQRIRAQDAWDANAKGSGSIAVVLDSGIDRIHPDFGTVGDCQLADNDCGSPGTDADGHGTQVAGVVAAQTNNALGVAGVAHGGKIKSIIVSADAIITLAEMTQGFTDTAAYGVAAVINASFSGGPWALVNVTALCASVNSAVVNGVTPVALAVAAAGNNNSNGFFYPARCNDASRPEHAALTRKDLFITVANSISSLTIDPLCAPAATLDARCGNSNYGVWVDMAAPGMSIRTTAVGGGYASPTGTSFAAPMVSGAAAVLHSCGVPFDAIESTLRSSALVSVPFPGGSSAPRLDLYEALKSRNRAPTALALSNNNLNENIDTSGGVEVGTLLTTDLDSCDKFTYSIVGGADAAAFSIGGSSADRLRIMAGVLDFETKPSYSVIVRVTDFGGQTIDQPLTVNINDLAEGIPNPILVFDRMEIGPNFEGTPVDRYYFTVSNWNAYPLAMFVERPDLPPCGLNNSASRTWVDFFRTSDNSRIYGFCALGTPANLNLIWFGVIPSGGTPPSAVYIKLIDRETGIEYISNSVAVPFP